jgi:hypothetical protein
MSKKTVKKSKFMALLSDGTYLVDDSDYNFDAPMVFDSLEAITTHLEMLFTKEKLLSDDGLEIIEVVNRMSCKLRTKITLDVEKINDQEKDCNAQESCHA